MQRIASGAPLVRPLCFRRHVDPRLQLRQAPGSVATRFSARVAPVTNLRHACQAGPTCPSGRKCRACALWTQPCGQAGGISEPRRIRPRQSIGQASCSVEARAQPLVACKCDSHRSWGNMTTGSTHGPGALPICARAAQGVEPACEGSVTRRAPCLLRGAQLDCATVPSRRARIDALHRLPCGP